MTESLIDLTIAELVRRHPATLDVLVANGYGMFADPHTLESFGGLLRLRTLLKAREINPGLFCRLLAERMADAERLPPNPPDPANVNLFALLPCPLKVPLEEAFTAFVAGLPPERRASLTWCIEGNANTQLDYADYAEHFETLAEMPDIIITPGFNSFFHRPFVERFILTGQFTSASEYAGDRHLAPLGIIDPQGHYTMLAMNLLVFVVDHERLGNGPVPRRWADLLEPVYGKSLAIRGNRDGSFCETLLLAVLKEFGPAALERLGERVRYGWHPSQMVKAAGSGRPDAPAVSVMPLFFAHNVKHRERVTIVWPEDGALVSPVTMLVKREKREELRDVVAFLTGPEVARICAGAFFPAVHPGVDNRLPDDATFKWIGWDYVREHDLKTLIAEANAIFQRGFGRDGA
jgi:ABC-type Fe3+ transport system substrate-binding protein